MSNGDNVSHDARQLAESQKGMEDRPSPRSQMSVYIRNTDTIEYKQLSGNKAGLFISDDKTALLLEIDFETIRPIVAALEAQEAKIRMQKQEAYREAGKYMKRTSGEK